jgi:hypothetical protein
MRLLFRNYCYDYDYCYDDHQEKTIWHWQLDGLCTACAVCVCVCMRAVSVFLCIYAATLEASSTGWPGLVTFVLRLLLQCVAGVRERRRKRSGCSCYGMTMRRTRREKRRRE